ncbi:MAG: nucleotidyltransferase [Phycisphaerae bacterium]|nr:nucleotidyltransferase [Phycisphaerae bacterium]
MADFENLLARLIEHQVEFVLVGGFAATAHGSTLLTVDVDICMRFSTDNLLGLQEAVAELHPVHRMTPRRLPLRLTPETCQDLKNLYLDTDFGQLDCLGMIQGVGDFERVKEQSVEVSLPGGICRILSLDALIRSKEAMGRPRDRESVLQLKAIRDRRARQGPSSISQM